MTYAEKLKDPRWQKKRLEIMERAGFKCEACGDSKETLHVHHGYYERGFDPWDYEDATLWCLCASCHELLAADLRNLHYEIAKIGPQHYASLLPHIKQYRKDCIIPHYECEECGELSAISYLRMHRGHQLQCAPCGAEIQLGVMQDARS